MWTHALIINSESAVAREIVPASQEEVRHPAQKREGFAVFAAPYPHPNAERLRGDKSIMRPPFRS